MPTITLGMLVSNLLFCLLKGEKINSIICAKTLLQYLEQPGIKIDIEEIEEYIEHLNIT